MTTEVGKLPTSNSHHRFRLLSPNEENNISLRRVDVVVLEEERLVNAILLQGRELDKQVQRTCKRLLKHEVLLASDLYALARVIEGSHHITLHPRAKKADPASLSL